MSTAALFTIAKTWKQLVHQQKMDKEGVLHIYTQWPITQS